MIISRRGFVTGAGALTASAGLVFAGSAEARVRPDYLSTLENGRSGASLVMEAETGRVLRQVNGEEPRIPASLVKPLGDMIIYDELRAGRMQFTDRVPITEQITREVRREESSARRFLNVSEASVQDLLHAKILMSSNEAAKALAVFIAGTEEDFAARMEAKARAIGCSDTRIRNATGYNHPEQHSTALDLCRIGRHLIYEYPEFYPNYGLAEYDGEDIDVSSHNAFLTLAPGQPDGIKTGYVRASGAHNHGSTQDTGRRVIVLAMGAQQSGRGRRAVRAGTVAALANAELARRGLELHAGPGLETPASAWHAEQQRLRQERSSEPVMFFGADPLAMPDGPFVTLDELGLY